MKNVIFFFGFLFALLLINSTPGWANTILSKESISDGIRRVVILDNNGKQISQFQKCDKTTSEWFEARLDNSTKKWVFTIDGESERRARIIYYKAEQARFERSFNRSQ